jgi:hypothetical protein
MKKLVDYTKVENFEGSINEARKIAEKKLSLSNIFHKEKCAFVAPKDLIFGMSRSHEALVDGSHLDTEVFRNIKEALQWLGVDSDDVFSRYR